MNLPGVNRHFVIFVGFFQYPEVIKQPGSLRKLGDHYQPWWTRKSVKEIEKIYNFLPAYFYASFNKVCFPEIDFPMENHIVDGPDDKEFNRIDLENYVNSLPNRDCLLHLTLDKDCLPIDFRVQFKGNELSCLVDYVDIFLYPRGEGMFSLKARVDKNDKGADTLEDVSALQCALRELYTHVRVNQAKPIPVGSWLDSMLFGYWPELEFPHLVSDHYYCNKLKSFCALELGENALLPENLGHILYELGTVSPIGSSSTPGPMKPAESYFQEILDHNRISVFDNWSGLSLFDTFTLLFHQPQRSYSLMHNAESFYLPIYIHSLYLKLILFKTNAEIANEHVLSRKNLKLRDWFIEVRNDFDLSQISYNFLPNLINNRMRFSLGICEELQFLESKVETINNYISEKQEQSTNRVLTILSVLALGSAFWDSSEWIQKLFGIPEQDYQILSGSLVTTVLLVVIIIILLGRRK